MTTLTTSYLLRVYRVRKKKKKNVDRVEETSFVETYIVARINALLIPGRK